MCKNGCLLYAPNDANSIECAHCKSPRYKDHAKAKHLRQRNVDLNAVNAPKLVPAQVLSIASVASALGELLIDDNFRKDLKYKHQFDDPANDSSEIVDIFSGDVYKKFRNEGIIQKNDICLVMLVDGFPPKHPPKSSSVLIHSYVMNISPDKRYARNQYKLESSTMEC